MFLETLEDALDGYTETAYDPESKAMQRSVWSKLASLAGSSEVWIPWFLVAFRCFVLLAALSHYHWPRSPYLTHPWLMHLTIGSMALLTLVAAAMAKTRLPVSQWRHWTMRLFVPFDIVLISAFYRMEWVAASDVYLMYGLPIFVAAEYLSGIALVITFGCITVMFGLVLASLWASGLITQPFTAFFMVFLPREVLYLFVVVAYAFRVRLEKTERERAVRRYDEIRALLKCHREAHNRFEVDDVAILVAADALRVVGSSGAGVCLPRQGIVRIESPTNLQSDDDRAALKYYVQKMTDKVIHDQTDSSWAVESHPASPIGRVVGKPIKVRERVLGALVVTGHEVVDFAKKAEPYLEGLAVIVGESLNRIELLRAFQEINAATADAWKLDQELDSVLDALTQENRFEYATISLVDEFRNQIETIRGRNVPPGWIARSRYSLKGKRDIQIYIVETLETKVLDKPDPLLNEEIYNLFEHEHLARVFVPITVPDEIRGGEKAIGTIEAGCRKERRDVVLTPENTALVTDIGRECGPRIARTLPQALLKQIAEWAIRLMEADSASLLLYDKDELLLAAYAGNPPAVFLDRFPPLAPKEAEPFHNNLQLEGLLAFETFPMNPGEDLTGSLCIHFWSRSHDFSDEEKALGIVFARQMGVAIQNYLLLKAISAEHERAWALSSFQNSVLALVSGRPLTEVLQEITRSVLQILDADVTILYQFHSGEGGFSTPPVINGALRQQEEMRAETHGNEMLRAILSDSTESIFQTAEEGGSFFIPDVEEEPALLNQSAGVSRKRFVEREGIRSCAILKLKSGESRDRVGCLFVNFRKRHTFTPNEKKTIRALAAFAAVAIRTARLHELDMNTATEIAERRKKEFDALRSVNEVIVDNAAGPASDSVFKAILNNAMSVVGAEAGEVAKYDPASKTLIPVAWDGFPKDYVLRHSFDQGMIGQAAQILEVLWAPNVHTPPWTGVYFEDRPETNSELVVPIHQQGELQGIINLEHSRIQAFTVQDVEFMKALAKEASIALRTVQLYSRLERQLEQTFTLSKTAVTIQESSDRDLDGLLRLLLTGITARSGLAFSRAMVFLVDETRRFVTGRMAVGPLTRTEAHETWDVLLRTGWTAQRV